MGDSMTTHAQVRAAAEQEYLDLAAQAIAEHHGRLQSELARVARELKHADDVRKLRLSGLGDHDGTAVALAAAVLPLLHEGLALMGGGDETRALEVFDELEVNLRQVLGEPV